MTFILKYVEDPPVPTLIPFRRGDAADDEDVNLSDAVVILLHLFAGRDDLDCLKAADTNDDGAIQLTDAVYLLNALFAGGAAPPPPHPDCAPDPTPDFLSCVRSACVR